MKSDTLAQLLDSLGASRSFSRPRVSNDNPHIESQFKTLKYQPDYPGYFSSSTHGRAWLQDFFAWHNDDHHHAGLALFTPADVFHGRVAEVAVVRQAALDAGYRAHPERFPNGAPRAPLPPAAVHINPIFTEAVPIVLELTGKSIRVEDAQAERTSEGASPPTNLVTPINPPLHPIPRAAPTVPGSAPAMTTNEPGSIDV
jgi:putative transposase